MSKQISSVDWLAENIPDLSKYIPFGVSMELHAKFQQAKAMHKEEIIEHHTWLLSGVMSETFAKKDAEKYYNEHYGNN